MPLQTVESTRLYRQIAGQIATLIDNREFPAGSRLPPERELAVLLGVSRTSVREAIIALELAGRVEVRVGTGIFVTHPGSQRKRDSGAGSPASAVDDGGAGPFDLLAARAMIEGEIAALAARNARKVGYRGPARDDRAHARSRRRFRGAGRRRPRVPRADRGVHAQRRAAVRRRGSVGPAARRALDADRRTFPHAGASRQDADGSRGDRRRARGARPRRGARGDAPASATRRARVPAPLGRDRRRQARQSARGFRKPGRKSTKQHAMRRTPWTRSSSEC